MAAKSFINRSSFLEVKEQFSQQIQAMLAGGHSWSWLSQKIAEGLDLYLQTQLKKLPSFSQVEVVKLGSWSRQELCPRSDIDVLLLGSESSVLQFVDEAAKAHVRLQYRTPIDAKNWLEGVEDFDHLALMYAEALSKSDFSLQVESQKKRAWAQVTEVRDQIIDLMKEERERRNIRYDSLANYLEPNLKYGPGALRDLQQALVTVSFYPEVFKSYKKEVSYLENLKSFLLVLRHGLHLQGAGDILVASCQEVLAQQLGFSSRLEFTTKLQKNLSEINFYSQWIHELVKTNPIKIEQIKNKSIGHLGEAIDFLLHDDGLLAREKVREIVKNLDMDQAAQAKIKETIRCDLPEQKYLALFQSGIFYKAFHHLLRVKGLVQYDHYHRYTVDAHTLQALRFFCKTKSSPEKYLGKNKEWVKDFSSQDWDILLWALLYHDLAKGLKGSHSELGANIVIEELSALGFCSEFYNEVSWLVKSHLILSEAAFRKNPEDPSTWQWLMDQGVKPLRLKWLSALTAIDIMATNIEAWTPWKSDLLYRLVQQVLSPKVENFVVLADELEGVASHDVTEKFLSQLEPMLASSLPVEILKDEFVQLNEFKVKALPVRVWRQDDQYSWVRFHSYEDRKGLFLGWSKLLFASGCLVREAYVHTLDSLGAYNWLMIKTRKSTKVLTRQLNLKEEISSPTLPVRFNSIKLIETSKPGHWIIRFKGQDQRGALVGAVQALFDQGLQVHWARVHTWGDVLEDVFEVSGCDSSEVEGVMEKLRQNYC